MTEVEIVRGWIDRAREVDHVMHQRVFWRVLDLLEGMTWAKVDMAMVDYLKENVRQSKNRDMVIAALENALKRRGV